MAEAQFASVKVRLPFNHPQDLDWQSLIRRDLLSVIGPHLQLLEEEMEIIFHQEGDELPQITVQITGQEDDRCPALEELIKEAVREDPVLDRANLEIVYQETGA